MKVSIESIEEKPRVANLNTKQNLKNMERDCDILFVKDINRIFDLWELETKRGFVPYKVETYSDRKEISFFIPAKEFQYYYYGIYAYARWFVEERVKKLLNGVAGEDFVIKLFMDVGEEDGLLAYLLSLLRILSQGSICRNLYNKLREKRPLYIIVTLSNQDKE